MYIDDLNEWYSDKEYMYSWFLTCLYHDTASCIEKISSAEKIYSANDLTRGNQIVHGMPLDVCDAPLHKDPFQLRRKSIPCGLFLRAPKKAFLKR